jgi:hypothetical protein
MLSKTYVEHVCACDACKNMCETTPCWGTPQEMKKIIDAGLGDRLGIVTWHGWGKSDVLAPARRGDEGEEQRLSIFDRKMPCTFYREGKCELHDKGLKPIEGRTAIHHGHPGYDLCDGLRKELGDMWDSPEGKQVMSDWKTRYVR